MSDSSSPLRILLVGAGAVGQVYGRHLQQGGAEISFFVKPAYAEQARAGFHLYPPRGGPSLLKAASVLTTSTEVAACRWDQVWLCTASPALHGPWLRPLLAAAPDATIILLQPGFRDRELLLTLVPAQRLVSGHIAIMAWQAPLPGETVASPGVKYSFPIGSPSLFSGAGAKDAVAALRRGGCPARIVKDAVVQSALIGALGMPIVVALELAGWSFATLRSGLRGRQGAVAAREALAIAAAFHGTSTFPFSIMARWPILSLMTHFISFLARFAPRILPADPEVYLRYHFTKVGEQTRQAMRTWIIEGKARGLPTAALEAQAAALETFQAHHEHR